MDYTMKEHLELNNKEVMDKIQELKLAVKEVNGTFVTLFHNEALSEDQEWEGWSEIYKKTIEH
jgi:hypothetical protein